MRKRRPAPPRRILHPDTVGRWIVLAFVAVPACATGWVIDRLYLHTGTALVTLLTGAVLTAVVGALLETSELRPGKLVAATLTSLLAALGLAPEVIYIARGHEWLLLGVLALLALVFRTTYRATPHNPRGIPPRRRTQR